MTPATVRADGQRVHKLKAWPEFYEKVRTNEKRHELRKDDRDFRVGDLLDLVEWDPNSGEGFFGQFTGRSLMRRVTYLMRDFYGLEPGHCLMSIEPVEASGDLVTGWDLTSKLALALGLTLPPDEDGIWGTPTGPIHHDDLPGVLAIMVSDRMERLLTERVAPSGPLTLEPKP